MLISSHATVASELLTPKQLAQRWCISDKTLERWRCEDTGPAYLKLGGQIRYRLDDALAFERYRLRLATHRAVTDADLEALS